MPRPPEYDGLLKIGSFKEAVPSKDSIAQFLRTADDMVVAAKIPMPDSARFFLAYEGMFSVVMAVLEFYEVRPADTGGHRATAIKRVAVDLKLDVPKQSVLSRLHDVRNRVTYRAPLPPITKADADALQAILEEMLSTTKALIGAPDWQRTSAMTFSSSRRPSGPPNSRVCTYGIPLERSRQALTKGRRRGRLRFVANQVGA